MYMENLVLFLMALSVMMLPFAIIYIVEESICIVFYAIHRILGGRKSFKQCRKFIEKKYFKFL